MATRIKLDLTAGTLEVEGTEAFVREVYNDFRSQVQSTPSTASRAARGKKSVIATKASVKRTQSKKASTRSGGRRNRNDGLTVVKDLNLRGGKGKEALGEVLGRLKPTSNMERNLVFVHYLKHTCGIDAVTANHVYTCYHTTQGVKIPGALRQSLIDTASRRAWIDTSSLESISVTTHGLNHLEHDMPSKGE